MTNNSFGAKNEYKTRDLHEAAFLYAKGKKLLRLEGGDREFWFIFDGVENCRILANSYWAREAEVVVVEYVDALRTLKDRIFAQR